MFNPLHAVLFYVVMSIEVCTCWNLNTSVDISTTTDDRTMVWVLKYIAWNYRTCLNIRIYSPCSELFYKFWWPKSPIACSRLTTVIRKKYMGFDYHIVFTRGGNWLPVGKQSSVRPYQPMTGWNWLWDLDYSLKFMTKYINFSDLKLG